MDLKDGGSRIAVTNDNRVEYVRLYVEYMVNKAVDRQFKAFYLGFHSVCSSNVLMLLRAEEIELLVCGNPVFDMKELRLVTTYDGYSPTDITIRLE